MKHAITVLLVQPNYNEKSDASLWSTNPPLGPCYIAAMLLKHNISVEILDANVTAMSVKKTVNYIKRKNPVFVGFSILTPAAQWCSKVVKQLPRSMIKIAGGPHVSSVPKEIIQSGFTIAAIGEGEMTMLDIAQGKSYDSIDGIVYKDGEKIIVNKPRIPLDPNTIPFPARHLIREGGTDKPYISSGTRYYPWAQLFSSRGCPYNCYFCNKNIFGYRFRPRTPENVLAEIDFLVQTYGVREIDVYDDNFNFDMERAEKIIDMIIARKYHIYLRFSNGLRADKVSSRLLAKMKKAGTDYIAYGVESGDERVIAQIPKGETLKQITKAVHLTNQAGIPVTGFFIFGLIGDTKESMQHTIHFMTKTGFDRAIINIATPYPGTRMWKIIEDKGGTIHIPSWAEVSHTSGKMYYSLPGMANPETVERMYRKAYSAFYFRPSYMMKQIPKLFSPSYFPIIVRGLTRIFYAQNVHA